MLHFLFTGVLAKAPEEAGEEYRSKGYLPIIYLDREKKAEPEKPDTVAEPVRVEPPKPVAPDVTPLVAWAERLELAIYDEIAAENAAKTDAAINALIEAQRIAAENDELALILLLAA